jgi:transcriptional repressor NrdR
VGILLKCPFCSFAESKVIDSRPTDDGERIRRRRECIGCAKRFTTYETLEIVSIMVIKKDKSRELFDRAKLLKGMLKACEKRPISLKSLEEAVNTIETKLQNSLEREVASSQIGEYVVEILKNIDEIAYVRFASVYREFKDVSTFMDELRNLLKEK